ncbi:hypothetical protein L209DRAFT_746118 [Thermothelomyces heterothallicus CBS 203.75]
MAVTPKSTTVQVEGGANEPSSPPGLPTSSQRKRVASQIASSGRPAIPGPFSPVFYSDIGSATAPRNLPLSPPFLVESLRVTGLKERWKLVKWIASDLGCAGVSSGTGIHASAELLTGCCAPAGHGFRGRLRESVDKLTSP